MSSALWGLGEVGQFGALDWGAPGQQRVVGSWASCLAVGSCALGLGDACCCGAGVESAAWVRVLALLGELVRWGPDFACDLGARHLGVSACRLGDSLGGLVQVGALGGVDARALAGVGAVEGVGAGVCVSEGAASSWLAFLALSCSSSAAASPYSCAGGLGAAGSGCGCELTAFFASSSCALGASISAGSLGASAAAALGSCTSARLLSSGAGAMDCAGAALGVECVVGQLGTFGARHLAGLVAAADSLAAGLGA